MTPKQELKKLDADVHKCKLSILALEQSKDYTPKQKKDLKTYYTNVISGKEKRREQIAKNCEVTATVITHNGP